jgi:hypothetical protein
MNEQWDSDDDDQEDEEEFIFTMVMPLLDEDPIEETIDLNLLLPQDLERLRRTDPCWKSPNSLSVEHTNA